MKTKIRYRITFYKTYSDEPESKRYFLSAVSIKHLKRQKTFKRLCFSNYSPITPNLEIESIYEHN